MRHVSGFNINALPSPSVGLSTLHQLQAIVTISDQLLINTTGHSHHVVATTMPFSQHLLMIQHHKFPALTSRIDLAKRVYKPIGC
jgi:hypothetical protein